MQGSSIEWLWKSAAQLPLSSSFQMCLAFLRDRCGNGFSLWEQSLPPQFISLFQISHCKLPKRGSWTGVACCELPGDGRLGAVRRKLCCVLRAENVMESLCVGKLCHPFSPNRPQPTDQLWRGHASHLWTACLWSKGRRSEPGAGLVTAAALQSGGGSHPQLPGYCCSSTGLQACSGDVKGAKGKLLSFGQMSACPTALSTARHVGKGRSVCSCHLSEVAICPRQPFSCRAQCVVAIYLRQIFA